MYFFKLLSYNNYFQNTFKQAKMFLKFINFSDKEEGGPYGSENISLTLWKNP